MRSTYDNDAAEGRKRWGKGPMKGGVGGREPSWWEEEEALTEKN